MNLKDVKIKVLVIEDSTYHIIAVETSDTVNDHYNIIKNDIYKWESKYSKKDNAFELMSNLAELLDAKEVTRVYESIHIEEIRSLIEKIYK